jgi:hypothetical protein
MNPPRSDPVVASLNEMPIPNCMGKVSSNKTTILLTGWSFVVPPGVVTRQKSFASDTIKKIKPSIFYHNIYHNSSFWGLFLTLIRAPLPDWSVWIIGTVSYNYIFPTIHSWRRSVSILSEGVEKYLLDRNLTISALGLLANLKETREVKW